MGATTFWTQRQMMARAGTAVDKQQQQIQKFMLYVLPLSFAVFGVNFPIGVLLYWLTTNIWSMGQQAWVIKRMPPVVPGSTGGGGKSGGPSGDRKGPPGGGGPDKPGKAKKAPEQPEQPDGTEASTAGEVLATTPAGSVRPAANRPGDKRSAGSRKNKKRGKR
jgi:YidC/Oxa1 family membrane protein insertase